MQAASKLPNILGVVNEVWSMKRMIVAYINCFLFLILILSLLNFLHLGLLHIHVGKAEKIYTILWDVQQLKQVLSNQPLIV